MGKGLGEGVGEGVRGRGWGRGPSRLASRTLHDGLTLPRPGTTVCVMGRLGGGHERFWNCCPQYSQGPFVKLQDRVITPRHVLQCALAKFCQQANATVRPMTNEQIRLAMAGRLAAPISDDRIIEAFRVRLASVVHARAALVDFRAPTHPRWDINYAVWPPSASEIREAIDAMRRLPLP